MSGKINFNSAYAGYRPSRAKAAALENNKLLPEDRAVHDWYRFILSYPPHLVRTYIEKFGLGSDSLVLDPFCGTGTTLIECKKNGIPSIGIESNPMAQFAADVKADWRPDPEGLIEHAQKIGAIAHGLLHEHRFGENPRLCLDQQSQYPLKRLPPESEKLLLTNSISPIPLHKVLILLSVLKDYHDERYARHELLALARAIVFRISNLHFGPEVGVGPPKIDAPVVSEWLDLVCAMSSDLQALPPGIGAATHVYHADARNIAALLPARSIDAVITSPPYPNEKDYTRTTRLESVLLGFISDRSELQALKRGLLRSNTRGVYKNDDDDQWVAEHPEIQRIANAIESRRIELGKTSGFERMYPRVTRLYFGGMARHLAELRSLLKPGAQLAYVVGDQASYLRIMIRTGQLLADIAQSLGYEVVEIELFRTRLATATKEQLREEVLILRWPG